VPLAKAVIGTECLKMYMQTCTYSDQTHRYLNFTFGDVEVMFIINVHPFQCITNSTIVGFDKKNYSKPTYKITRVSG
jgi:hypothetical protein